MPHVILRFICGDYKPPPQSAEHPEKIEELVKFMGRSTAEIDYTEKRFQHISEEPSDD